MTQDQHLVAAEWLIYSKSHCKWIANTALSDRMAVVRWSCL